MINAILESATAAVPTFTNEKSTEQSAGNEPSTPGLLRILIALDGSAQADA